MSTLGDQIREQKRVAQTVSSDLDRCAAHLRTQVDATDWTSSAATACKARLHAFSGTIERLSGSATALAHALDTHATSVDAQEMMDALNPASATLRVPPGMNTKATCTVLPPREPQILFPVGPLAKAQR